MLRALVLSLLVLGGCESRSSNTSEQPRILVDINSATRTELAAMPEIGPAYAARIVAGRPYDNKTQLVSRGILPDAVYKKIAPMVIARQK